MTQATIKIVEIPLEKEFVEPKGWILKDIHNSDNQEKFYGVLVKEQKPLPKVNQHETKLDK